MLHQAFRDLREQSTWRLLFLIVVTYGVYGAYYCQRQSHILNKNFVSSRQISDHFSRTMIMLNWANLLLFVPYQLVEPGNPIEFVSEVVNSCSLVLFIVWGFMARDRLNELLQANPGDDSWSHGLWTFLFSPLYNNYKVNTLSGQG